MSTSQKFRSFVDEPMGDKPVDALAGIGEVLGTRLKEQGFEKAFNVLGQFLILNKDEELFVDWLRTSINANSKQGTDCFKCLKTWCDNYL